MWSATTVEGHQFARGVAHPTKATHEEERYKAKGKQKSVHPIEEYA